MQDAPYDPNLDASISGDSDRPRRIDPNLEAMQLNAVNQMMNAYQSRRLTDVARKKAKKSALKAALPYLVAGGSTATGLGIGLSNLIF